MERDFFASRGYRIPTRILPDILIRLFARLMPKLKNVADQLDWNYDFSTEQARSILDWKPRPSGSTIPEMAKSLI